MNGFSFSLTKHTIIKIVKIQKFLVYFGFKGAVLVKNRQKVKIDFIVLNESRMIQLQFATNRIQIGPLESEPAKGVRRHYAGPMSSRDVISLPPVTISLATLYNCFLTMEDST